MESKFKLPTETITLPSKGLLYSAENPLSKGEIEMSYMSAKHEDILTNINYIKNGTAIDKLLQALVVTPINFDDLIIGDKNAILIAARILGYGKDYPIRFYNTSTSITFKFLTGADEKKITQELNGLKKLYPNDSFDLTTRLKYMITSVEGSRETKDIREFVDNYLTAQDSRAFREYYSKVMPDIDLDITIEKDGYTQEGVTIPIGINFFWPDAGA